MSPRRAAAGIFLGVSIWLGRARAGGDELDWGGASLERLRPRALSILGSPAADLGPGAHEAMGAANGADASVSAPAMTTPARRSSEGTPWGMLLAPVASAGAAVAWVLARRGRRQVTASTAISNGPPSAPSGCPIAPMLAPSSTGSAMPALEPVRSEREAVTDAAEAEEPFRAPLLTPEAFVHPTSTSSPIVTSRPLPSSSRISVVLEAASPASSGGPPDVARPSETDGGEAVERPRSPDARSSEPKPFETSAFDAWMAAARAEAAKASEARLTAALSSKARGLDGKPAEASFFEVADVEGDGRKEPEERSAERVAEPSPGPKGTDSKEE